MKYHQLTSEQRSQIFVLLQKRTPRKDIAQLVGISQSTLSREFKRNKSKNGLYLYWEANEKALSRRKRTTANSRKDPVLIWEALDLVKSKQWSPKQVSGYMKKQGKFISHELIYQHIRADKSGELSQNCRHKMKYNRHGKPRRNTKVKNIPNRVSIHERPAEANGTRFGDWEMDTIVGKNGKGAILTLTERSTNYLIMEKLPKGKNAEALAKVVIRQLFPYRGTGVLTITTDNGCEFCAHEKISLGLKNVPVYFADSYASWQKGSIENMNKLIRQYIPKGVDFSSISNVYIKKVQSLINERPREKLNFSSPKYEFFRHFR